VSQESRDRGIALIEQVIDQLSSISARAMSANTADDPSDVYTACGEMQLTLQEAIALLEADPTDSPAPRRTNG
jgi:hypothetical protein